MSIDYIYKSNILKTDLCKRINAIDKKTYLNHLDGIIQDYDLDNKYFDLCLEYQYKDIVEARKINTSSYKRVKRLNKRIETYLQSGQCIWLTITFNDTTLSNTSEKTRRRYVSRFLKSVSTSYLANIDYGKTTEREHYHAVVLCDFVDPKCWSYGFIYTERIKNHINAPVKLSKYVSKLTNHAIKESTKRNVYIYSRNI